jgi:hypothetical protein
MPAWLAIRSVIRPSMPASPRACHVALQRGLEGLLLLPLRVLISEGLDPVQREGELGVHGLFHPKRAVVVEHGDALGRRHEVGAALGGHGLHEGDDGLLGLIVGPGRQRVGGGRNHGESEDEQKEWNPHG